MFVICAFLCYYSKVMSKLFKSKTEAWISSAGLAVLAVLFLYWWMHDDAVNIAGHLAALAAVSLFAVVCLRFVPAWLAFWSEENNDRLGDKADAKTLAALFVSFLLLDFVTIVLIHAIRVLVFGDTTSFAEGLRLFLHIDSGYYLNIAQLGYTPDKHLVFYPGYPVLIRLLNFAVGDYLISALILSALFYALSACMLYKLLLLDFPKESALRGVKYLAILPGAFFFAAPMTESLFLFLSISALYLARREKWFPACLLAAYSAFTRSLGVLVFAPLFFEAVKEKNVKHVIMCFIVPLGTLAFLFINYKVTGDAFAFSKIEEEQWSQSLGFFFDTTAFQVDNALADVQQPWFTSALGLWFPNVAWCFAALLLFVFAAKELRPSYTVWFIVYYVFAIGATYLISAPRYLIACAPVYPALTLVAKNKKADAVLTAACIVFALYYLFAFAARWEVF